MIILFFYGCCKVGYTYITISNLSEKTKYYKAYAILKNNKQNIGWDELNELKATEKSEIIIQGFESRELKESGEEKRIVIIYFDTKKNKKGKEFVSEKDSIIKSFSMNELENKNWKITFSEN
jgi:hypothetical protein